MSTIRNNYIVRLLETILTQAFVVHWALNLHFFKACNNTYVVDHHKICSYFSQYWSAYWKLWYWPLKVWTQAPAWTTVICHQPRVSMTGSIHQRYNAATVPIPDLLSHLPYPRGSRPFVRVQSSHLQPPLPGRTPFIKISLFSCPATLRFSRFLHYSLSHKPRKSKNWQVCNTASQKKFYCRRKASEFGEKTFTVGVVSNRVSIFMETISTLPCSDICHYSLCKNRDFVTFSRIQYLREGNIYSKFYTLVSSWPTKSLWVKMAIHENNTDIFFFKLLPGLTR